jgi:hypothetical protein
VASLLVPTINSVCFHKHPLLNDLCNIDATCDTCVQGPFEKLVDSITPSRNIVEAR